MLADHHLVFVYGLLKRGFSLHHHLSGCEFVGEAITEPDYYLVDCREYPGLRHAEAFHAGESIRGEVFRVSSHALRRLDDVEGVSEGLYCREYVRVQGPFADQQVWAWFYVSDQFDGDLLRESWV